MLSGSNSFVVLRLASLNWKSVLKNVCMYFKKCDLRITEETGTVRSRFALSFHLHLLNALPH